MDTTTSSSDEAYVSCITIDGIPILPPIMTEAKRAEMRHYRQVALEREHKRISSRQLNDKKKTLVLDSTRPATSSSSDFSPATDCTSTPCGFKHQVVQNKNFSPLSKIPVPLQVAILQRDKNATVKENEFIPISLPVSTSTSTSSLIECDMEAEDHNSVTDSESGGNFASAGSSTGTFIINANVSEKLGQTKTDGNNDSRSEGEVEELEEEFSNEEPTTVIRKSVNVDSYYHRRKRPARYFDTNDSDGETQPSLSTTGTSSTSLSKYFTATPTIICNSTSPYRSVSTPFMPNLVPENTVEDLSRTITATHHRSPSFTINTNFAATALSLSGSEEKSPRSTKRGNRKSSRYSRTPEKSPQQTNISLKTTDPDFDFILTNEVPLSAQKFDNSMNNGECKTPSDVSDSDKENYTEKKKHVRKLSYTLATPSAALLAATNSTSLVDGKVVFTQNLDPIIQSASNSVGNPSVQSTPAKRQEYEENCGHHTSSPSSGDLESRIDKVQSTLVQLQQLHLGKGKKAHLERYLEELKVTEKGNKEEECKTDPQKNSQHKIEGALSKIQDEHQKQLETLMEVYKQQAQRMHEAFELEKAKILSNISAEKTLKDMSSVSNNATIIAAPSPILADTSNLRNFYITNSTSLSKNGLNSVLSREISVLKSGNSVHSGSIYDGHSHLGTPAVLVDQIGTVRLSKLQNKMHKINPSIFKYPADVRSPLLKGLVFPDPLERPNAVVIIPTKAYDPDMKPKFDRLTAAVKGYLTRRLLHTEKIQIIIQTIKDTVELLLNLYEESPPTENGFQLKPQDEDLHKRLLQQLTGACSSFHDIFFKVSVKARMAIIANDREKIRAKAMRNVLNRHLPTSPSKRNISNATMKSIERRLTLSLSPGKKGNQSKIRKSVKPSAYGNQLIGSQSVKPKAVRSYNLSPKRRRLSYWSGNEKPKSARPTSAMPVKLDGRKWKESADNASARSIKPTSSHSARESGRNVGWSSDTFLIPSSNSRQNSWQSNTSTSSTTSTKANNSRSSTTNTRFSVGNSNSSRNRAPWK